MNLVILHLLYVVAYGITSGFKLPLSATHNTPINGILNIYKPVMITSNDACQMVKKIIIDEMFKRKTIINKPKIKVGHGGTLDMHAEGVLAIGIGNGTKMLPYYLKGDKIYEAIGILGFETDTLDVNGNVMKEEPWEHVTQEALNDAINSMSGTYDQLPPMYSSKKYHGKTLREYAIKKLPVVLKATPVTIHSIRRIHELTLELPKFAIRTKCSSGTYVRSLIRDIAYKLGTVATMCSLVRTSKQNLAIEDAIRLDDLDYDKIVANIITCNK
ncbi:putative tRNA pseudouridine (55) synthase [Babesia bovis T2Bo]|uniref:putative tRNA pseudouridine (55) synthase n=1 Tax=Babesia bovis T2Bo TaxID=484906 RepID=UPI001C367F9B|nr:putative tRNA pseudouridine (55) synthase [Babesia bovis T2Bo]EDO08135.2 putative tRNA pseudouridine (55) synthase [Babesia bovis T2Bo]